jgi:adhesin transport system outer membrane protein
MASYAEEAAKSKVNSVYLDVLDQINESPVQHSVSQPMNGYRVCTALDKVRVYELLSLGGWLKPETARYDIYSSIVQYIAATGRSRQAYDLNNISIQGFEVSSSELAL